jgi:hypothetical protein
MMCAAGGHVPRPLFGDGRQSAGVRWRIGALALTHGVVCLALVCGDALAQQSVSEAPTARATRAQRAGERLLRSYPQHLAAVTDTMLVWRDGTRMPIDDGLPEKSFDAWLAHPDLKDMLRLPYPAGSPLKPPAANADPGRARHAAFFAKMYGDCRKGEVERNLVDVAWLPSHTRVTLKATRINGVADKLAAVGRELDALPPAFMAYLVRPAGTYNCRAVAGTDQASAHGYGIAVDIAIKHAHYWRWSKAGADGRPVWRNEIPSQIVAIFERHGFIWGGRWDHFDTMHFEYRPELLPP